MSEENKALVRRFVDEVYNEGNLGFIDEVLSPDWVEHDPNSPEGIGNGVEGARRFAAMYRSAFPDLQITVEDQVAEGDKVVTRWTARGTHRGELMGVPPGGNRVEVAGIGIDRIEGGRVVESWSNYDVLGLMQQIGAVPSAERARA